MCLFCPVLHLYSLRKRLSVSESSHTESDSSPPLTVRRRCCSAIIEMPRFAISSEEEGGQGQGKERLALINWNNQISGQNCPSAQFTNNCLQVVAEVFNFLPVPAFKKDCHKIPQFLLINMLYLSCSFMCMSSTHSTASSLAQKKLLINVLFSFFKKM